jgi:hypothetical protein
MREPLSTSGLLAFVKTCPDKWLWYLGSVYTQCPWGLEIADKQAKALGARLFDIGITNFFCPIAHCHDMASMSSIDKTSHDIWMAIDQRFIDRCEGMIVPVMENWEKSRGLAYEMNACAAKGQPVIHWDFKK